jgi:sirohydrochlorin cobaltochelatase
MRTHRLILLAHGSSRSSWRLPIEAMAERLAAELGAGSVAVAYLELCPPTLIEVARVAVAEGIERLTVLPLFWSGGGHVTRDIPPQVDEIRQELPDLDIVVESAVGEHPALIQALVGVARLAESWVAEK